MQEIELLDEAPIWRTREVKYMSGKYCHIKEHIPSFELQGFFDHDSDAVNPYYKTVIRLPLSPMEKKIPVGIVSNTYTLAKHIDVANLCVEGIRECGIDVSNLSCELGLSTLGEWMNFRIYFPEEYDYPSVDRYPLKLRLECFNSVDGSSKLVILFGWFRLICSNGMVIGETISELRDVHNQYMDLSKVKSLIGNALSHVQRDTKQMSRWEKIKINPDALTNWVDTKLSSRWGKFSAFRVFHICTSGHDAKYSDPFESKIPSRKSSIPLDVVPGAPDEAKNLYDVMQALSWVATNRNNAEEKTKWQSEIPHLIEDLISV